MYCHQDYGDYYVDEGEQPTFPKPTVRKNQGLSTSTGSNDEPAQIHQVKSSMNRTGKAMINVDWMIKIDGIDYKLHGGEFFTTSSAEYIYSIMANECANGYYG